MEIRQVTVKLPVQRSGLCDKCVVRFTITSYPRRRLSKGGPTCSAFGPDCSLTFVPSSESRLVRSCAECRYCQPWGLLSKEDSLYSVYTP